MLGNRYVQFILLLLLLAFAHVGMVRAEEMSSPSFRITNTLVDDFGGYSTSTNFSTDMGGGQTVSGRATSTNFDADMGAIPYDTFTLASQNWRWYDDESNETPTSALAAENSAPTNIEQDDVIKLRITALELADIGAANVKLRLQYGTTSDFSSGGYDVVEAPVCTGSSRWCYDNGGGVDNALITTALLTDADVCVASAGDGCGTHNETATTTGTATQVQSAATEYEFTIKQSGAVSNTVYFFRLVNHVASTSVAINTGETYPSLVTGGSTLTFTVNGLSSGVSTEGVTTDITTTPSSIPFGSLAIGSQIDAAHRLTVTTNATNGYKVYTYQRQGLINERSTPIDPVTGTNASPLAWTTGCSGSAYGCYGYHSGEDVLTGGSTRFSANDTFAGYVGALDEIAYDSGPVTNKNTDMVYRVEVREEQEDGNYESEILYIITPIF